MESKSDRGGRDARCCSPVWLAVCACAAGAALPSSRAKAAASAQAAARRRGAGPPPAGRSGIPPFRETPPPSEWTALPLNRTPCHLAVMLGPPASVLLPITVVIGSNLRARDWTNRRRAYVSRTPGRPLRDAGKGTRTGARDAAPTVFADNKRRVQHEHRTGAQVRSRHLCRVVRRAGREGLAGEARDRRRLRRCDGRDPGPGHGAPLRRQHRQGPPGDRMRQDPQEPGRAARAQAHAPRARGGARDRRTA